MSTAVTKPVKLQVNDSGSWRNVIRFDAAQDMQYAEVLSAAATLGWAAQRSSLRVVIDDGLQTPLKHWTREKGWVSA